MQESVTTAMQFSPDGQEGILRVARTVVRERPTHLDGGGTMRVTTITHYDFRTTDFVVDKLPKSCTACPCGISCNGEDSCGRNVPLEAADYERRPDTCKLIDIETYLELTGQLSHEQD